LSLHTVHYRSSLRNSYLTVNYSLNAIQEFVFLNWLWNFGTDCAADADADSLIKQRLQRRRTVQKSEGAGSSNVVGIICPPSFGIGLTNLPKNWRPPRPPFLRHLWKVNCKQQMSQGEEETGLAIFNSQDLSRYCASMK
jgi:hypothetical protein